MDVNRRQLLGLAAGAAAAAAVPPSPAPASVLVPSVFSPSVSPQIVQISDPWIDRGTYVMRVRNYVDYLGCDYVQTVVQVTDPWPKQKADEVFERQDHWRHDYIRAITGDLMTGCL
jgi:hypothetical protein